jgi:hypothetical protein
MAARDAQEARAAAIAQGMEGIQNMGQMAMQMAPLYTQNIKAQKAAVGASVGNKDVGDIMTQDYKGEPVGLIDFNEMSNAEFKDFKKWLSPEQRRVLFQSKSYTDNYNPFNPFL